MARSRLSEAQRDISPDWDEESGEVPLSILAPFIRESEAINKVLVWAEKKSKDTHTEISAAKRNMDDRALERTEKKLDDVEKKLRAVRTRLTRMASENGQFVREHQSSAPGSVQTRLVQYRKMGQDFIDNIDYLSKARTALRDARQTALNDDVLALNPNADVKSLAAGRMDVDQVMQSADDTARASWQLDTIKSRNADIQKMAGGITELFELMQDMSVLVNSQQDMINDVEYNVQETKAVAETAVQELEAAHEYKKKATKKRRCLVGTALCVILIILAGLGTWLFFFIQNRRRGAVLSNALRN